MKKRKISNVIKQSFRKLKYLDKTQLNYFLVMSFLLGFCLFTGTTYSYFTFSKHLNAATITIAKLNYTLSSPSSDFVNGDVTIQPGEKKVIDLNLASGNKIKTKYALKYSAPATSGAKVYYSESYRNNMEGIIGPEGSNIAMRVIIVNDGSFATTVNLTISGGYLQNTLETNITEGYFEEDIVLRAVLLEDGLTNGIIGGSFPEKGGEYSYFKTECSGNVTPSWNNDEWKLEIDEVESRIACDVYFKKMSSDLEVYLVLEDNEGNQTYTTTVPNDGTYDMYKATCNTEATATWDRTNWKMNVTNAQKSTMCTGYFTNPANLTYITFQIVNGTWADGSTDDIKVPYKIDGSTPAVLGNNIPTEMKSLIGYGPSYWNINITAETPVTGNATYIYTFYSGGGGGSN